MTPRTLLRLALLLGLTTSCAAPPHSTALPHGTAQSSTGRTGQSSTYSAGQGAAQRSTRPSPPPSGRTPAPTPALANPTSGASRDPHSGLRWIARQDLPREGQRVLAMIPQGGPWPSSRDGAPFANRERHLPRTGAAYREYTVPTPGASDRGARRIVCAGPARSAAECYYTPDHYATFRRIHL